MNESYSIPPPDQIRERAELIRGVLRRLVKHQDKYLAGGEWLGADDAETALDALLAELERERAVRDAYRTIALQSITAAWKRTPKLMGETPETRLEFLRNSLLAGGETG